MTDLHYDIVGSFLRPEALKEARQKFTAGEISQAELTHVENQEIDRLIQKKKNLVLRQLPMVNFAAAGGTSTSYGA